jgi:hypothetical protein
MASPAGDGRRPPSKNTIITNPSSRFGDERLKRIAAEILAKRAQNRNPDFWRPPPLSGPGISPASPIVIDDDSDIEVLSAPPTMNPACNLVVDAVLTVLMFASYDLFKNTNTTPRPIKSDTSAS